MSKSEESTIINTESGMASSMPNPQDSAEYKTVYVVESNKRQSPTIKKTGRDMDAKYAKSKTKKYVSTIKDLMIFKSEKEIIKFVDYWFETNVPSTIQFMDTNRANGTHYWENEYPKEVRDRLEADKRYLTKIEGEHEK